MNVSVEKQDSAHLVKVSGEVDMNNAPQLRKALMALVEARVPLIIVSLAGVRYIATAGIATLVECRQKVSQYKGKLRLAEIRKDMLEIFKMAKLDGIFEIYATEREALG